MMKDLEKRFDFSIKPAHAQEVQEMGKAAEKTNAKEVTTVAPALETKGKEEVKKEKKGGLVKEKEPPLLAKKNTSKKGLHL